MLYLLMRLKMKTIFSIFSFLLLLFFLIYLKYAVQQFFNPKVILGKGGGLRFLSPTSGSSDPCYKKIFRFFYLFLNF